VALAPDHFISSFSAGVATQNKFVGQFKVMGNANSHSTVGVIHHDAIVRSRVWFGLDGPYVANGPT
jgi:hypothetical protein